MLNRRQWMGGAALLGLLVLPGCVTLRSSEEKPVLSEDAQHAKEAGDASSAQGPATAEGSAPLCPLPFRAPEDWLQAGPVLLGEVHGTQECPRLALSMVCHAASAGTPVRLGLELPRTDQQRLEAFLRTGERAGLLKGDSWTRAYQDGRTSEAFVELLEGVRRLQQRGLKVSVVAYDVDPSIPTEDRDLSMAEELLHHARASRDPLIVLVGNIHARTAVALPRPMGWRLKQAGLHPRSVLLEATAGEAWYCNSLEAASCGAHPGGRVSSGEAPLEQFSGPVEGVRGYDVRWLVPRFSVSPPAVKTGSPSSSVASEASPTPRPAPERTGQ